MSLSKANLDLSKPLSADERHLLMTLQQRACNSQEILTESEGLEEWGLASEGQGCAMSDASKRRMTEFVGHADHPPAGYTSLAPSPPLHPFISTVEGEPGAAWHHEERHDDRLSSGGGRPFHMGSYDSGIWEVWWQRVHI